MEYEFYETPSHGYLKVKSAEIFNLGILPQISTCSPSKNNYTFLEEDCDMPVFLEAKKAKNEPISLKTIHVTTKEFEIVSGYK